MSKPRIATTSLCGCFGCHMSLLDIDERILDLAELVEFDRSPINDIKDFTGRCAVGLIEGGCCNAENVHVLRRFREHCDVLVSVGDCATRAAFRPCATPCRSGSAWSEAYVIGPSVHNPKGRIPDDPEIPLLARQGLSRPRGREDRLPPARLPAARRRRSGRP